MDQQGNWDKYLPLFEFAYNNSYQQNLVQETTERIKHIREKIQTAQSRQKSYADIRRRPLEFNEGDHIFLRVTPTTGIGRALRTKKLNPRYLGPFQILKRVGPVAYQVALPPYLSNLHDVFHVSQLKKYNPDESHVLQPETVQLRADLTYQTLPVKIVERSDKQLRDKTVSLVKVAWGQTGTEEYTWELEDKMRTDYPFLFSGFDHGNLLLMLENHVYDGFEVAVGAAGKCDIPDMKIMIIDAYLMCI
nr:uncharacterized protein LOC112734777 [Arachis hypogaea]